MEIALTQVSQDRPPDRPSYFSCMFLGEKYPNLFSDRSLSSGNVFTQVQKYCDVHTHDFATETFETHNIPTNTIVLGRGRGYYPPP